MTSTTITNTTEPTSSYIYLPLTCKPLNNFVFLVCRQKDFQNYLEGKIRAITQLTLQQSITSAYILHGTVRKFLKISLLLCYLTWCLAQTKVTGLLISLVWPEAICMVSSWVTRLHFNMMNLLAVSHLLTMF